MSHKTDSTKHLSHRPCLWAPALCCRVCSKHTAACSRLREPCQTALQAACLWYAASIQLLAHASGSHAKQHYRLPVSDVHLVVQGIKRVAEGSADRRRPNKLCRTVYTLPPSLRGGQQVPELLQRAMPKHHYRLPASDADLVMQGIKRVAEGSADRRRPNKSRRTVYTLPPSEEDLLPELPTWGRRRRARGPTAPSAPVQQMTPQVRSLDGA